MRVTKKDIPRVNYILSQDDVFDHCIDDSVPRELRWNAGTVLLRESTIAYMPNKYTVLFADPILNSSTVHVHVAVAPEGRGLMAINATKEVIQHFWATNPTIHKMVAFAPVNNKRLLHFTTLVGFDREGVLKKSFFKDGKLMDQIIYGLSREV